MSSLFGTTHPARFSVSWSFYVGCYRHQTCYINLMISRLGSTLVSKLLFKRGHKDSPTAWVVHIYEALG